MSRKGKHSDKGDNKKAFFIPFTVTDKSGSDVKGIFQYSAHVARKALVAAKQQSGAIEENLPQNEYRTGTVRLSDQVYTSQRDALRSIGTYDDPNLDGTLLIRV